ncbi:MAG: hypothetical protein JSV68_02730 [Anaerolineaceae bacterium]|nr:MAG: hypothetical protein JSV68_02730 [Anaerolineaceae bacterium]
MDPNAIAASAIAILSPYLVKAGEEIAKGAGQAAWKKTGDIYEAIKVRFAKEEDDFPAQTLEQFEKSPDKRKGAMQDVLGEILAHDPAFTQQLTNLLKEADDAGAGAVFNVNIFGGEVGEIINVDKLEGGIKIDKSSGK